MSRILRTGFATVAVLLVLPFVAVAFVIPLGTAGVRALVDEP